jgi:hypothetical protein
LLVVVAHNLVDDVLPVTSDIAVKEPAIVKRLSGRQECLQVTAGLEKRKLAESRYRKAFILVAACSPRSSPKVDHCRAGERKLAESRYRKALILVVVCSPRSSPKVDQRW